VRKKSDTNKTKTVQQKEEVFYDALIAEQQIKQLGARIRQLRIQKGYTNAEFFAYDHRINRSQYGKYERGEDLRFSSLLRILQIHNLTLQEFFSDGF